MTGRSKAHRSSKRNQDEFSDWSPWDWNFERACWMRQRVNARGRTDYQYGESKKTEPDNQPRNSPAPQQEELLRSDLTELDYSTGENYLHGQGFGPRSDESASNQEWSNQPESSQIQRPTYPSSSTYPHTSSSSYGPDDQFSEVPTNLTLGDYSINFPASSQWQNTSSENQPPQPNSDSRFSQPTFSNPVIQRTDAMYKLTSEFESTNLSDPLERLSQMNAQSFNVANRPDIRSSVSNEDPLTDQETIEQNSYDNLKIERGHPAVNYLTGGAENDLPVNMDRQGNQGRLSRPKPISIVTKDSETKEDPLFKEFHVHKSGSFRVGKIFKTLWSEPYGGNTNEEDMDTRGTDELRVRDGKHGERVYSTIRRFIIVKAKKGHCVCVPILTYGKQGTAKPGVKADYHAIIYTGDRVPKEVDGEPKLLKKAIRVVTDGKSERLRPESRVNYSKIYTVEHNVKVSFIGMIHKDSEGMFMADFQRVFDD